MEQNTKRIPKVGDRIRLSNWSSRYHTVLRIEAGRVFLKTYDGRVDPTYSLYHAWIFENPEVTLDLTKPVQTCNGRPVTILTVGGLGAFPLIGLCDHDGVRKELRWSADGKREQTYGVLSALVNVPEKPTAMSMTLYLRKRRSDGKTKLSFLKPTTTTTWETVASKEVTITEGEGM